ncbi:PREDICTED: protein GTLF3B [Galeopterus variegatus]|uniref:Protein NATD1 n=1 Tax=Galeopterus variegatus TaxID=482537 RepID=A0ABM0RLK5_GALVR|nr:PREDICTED: protein GTLF3B [Galeopterus variegatus]
MRKLRHREGIKIQLQQLNGSKCLSHHPGLYAWVCWAPIGLYAGAAEPLRPLESPRAHLSLPSLPPGCHDRAVLLYEYVGKRIVDLQHTEVPDAYRGRGIAKHLAKAALDFVVEEDLRAHLTCWYIQKYVKENPLPQYLERLQP